MMEVDGITVLPWFAAVSETAIPVGTRLFSFSDYHRAPEGTVIRLGRKNGSGEVLVRRGNAWWGPDPKSTVPGLTAYGLENRASYVIPGIPVS